MPVLPAHPPAMPATEPAPPADHAFRLPALLSTLLAGLRAIWLSPRAPAALRGGVATWIALELLALLAGVGFEFARVGPDGEFDVHALPGRLFHLPCMLLCAWAIGQLTGRGARVVPALLGLTSLWLWISIAWGLLALLPEAGWDALGDAASVVWELPLGWGLLATVLLLCRVFEATPLQRFGVAGAVGLCLMLPQWAIPAGDELWVANAPAEDPAEAERWKPARGEAMLYHQPRLLDEALRRVQPGTPGQPELYLLALAGHGAQDVFLREVDQVAAQFAQRFGTAARSIVLANNPATVLTRPLATVSALEASLRTIGQRMNPDEDVLFMFLTSHGAADHQFDLTLWPWQFEQLTPQRLAGLLDAAGIRHRVILVSACYSGGFVPPLSGPDALVMSAARADRSSHGCSHEADWTFFGRAFFDEALRATPSFTQAFERARAAVAQREKAEGYAASEPQISVGTGIAPVLARWEAAQTAP
jgi:hypothetical protein